jgi:hypothetical protein
VWDRNSIPNPNYTQQAVKTYRKGPDLASSISAQFRLLVELLEMVEDEIFQAFVIA